MGIIEARNKRLVVSGTKLPKGDNDILTHLLIKSDSAFELMSKTGKIYVQYVQYRLRVLVSLGIVIHGDDRGMYEINPELRDELKNAIDEVQRQIEEEKAKKNVSAVEEKKDMSELQQ